MFTHTKINRLATHVKRIGKNPWWLNLNTYRNTHVQLLAKYKRDYHRELKAALGDKPDIGFEPPYHFEYTLYFVNKGRVDLMNVGSIVDKFATDALVELGVLEDDDRLTISKVSFIDGGVTKHRCADLVIRPYKK